VTAQVHGQKTIDGLRRLSAGIELASQRILAAAVLAAESSAKGTALFKDQTGGTRGSIKGTVGLHTGKVVAKGAAKFLENGTRAHTIAARNGGMLRFFVNGSPVFRRSVRHPGTASRPFMMQARLHAEHVVDYAAEIYIGEAIARA
jgi:hypothetical protein